MPKINILGIEINKIDYTQTLKKIDDFINDKHQHYLVTPNPEIVLKAMNDDYYKGILNNADLSLADGFGLILGSWFLGNPLYQRVTGVDLCWKIADLSAKKGYKIFLLGSQDKFVKLAKTKLELKLKNIKIVGAESGFKDIHNISQEENHNIIKKINDSKAQILLVAYGAPFQEKWIYKNLKNIPKIKVAIGIGGAIDFISERVMRAPKIMRKLGLEWLWRLFIEPKRIQRITNATVIFCYNLIKWKIFINKNFRKNVLIIILNSKNQILIGNRKKDLNHWQLPQGGINYEESVTEAGFREIQEEAGLTKLKFLGVANKINKYYFYPDHWKTLIKEKQENASKFCGQEQKIVFFRQTENETPQMSDELVEYKWIDKKDLLKNIHPIRHNSAKIVLEEINQFIN